MVESSKRNSPDTDENPAIQLGSNGRLIALDKTCQALRFLQPTLFLSGPYSVQLHGIGFNTLPQAFDLVNGESVVANEEVFRGEI
jgi:hypothetical protein